MLTRRGPFLHQTLHTKQCTTSKSTQSKSNLNRTANTDQWSQHCWDCGQEYSPRPASCCNCRYWSLRQSIYSLADSSLVFRCCCCCCGFFFFFANASCTETAKEYWVYVPKSLCVCVVLVSQWLHSRTPLKAEQHANKKTEYADKRLSLAGCYASVLVWIVLSSLSGQNVFVMIHEGGKKTTFLFGKDVLSGFFFYFIIYTLEIFYLKMSFQEGNSLEVKH